MLARANSACLLGLSRSDRRVLALLLLRVDCAVLCCFVLCCAVLEVWKYHRYLVMLDEHARIYVVRIKTRKEQKYGKIWPIIVQLDLQSVKKVPFSTFAWAFAPKMLEIGLPRLKTSRSILQDLSRAVSRSFFPIRSGIAIVFDPIGSKKC